MMLPHDDQKYIYALLHNDQTLIEEIYQNQLMVIGKIYKECNGCLKCCQETFKSLLLKVYYWARDQLENTKILLQKSFDQLLISLFQRVRRESMALSKPIDGEAQALSKTLDKVGTTYFNNPKSSNNTTQYSGNKTKHLDHQYIDALLEKNSVLIKEIYKRNAKPVTSMIKNMGGTTEDARGVFQEALMKLLKQAQSGFILTCPLNAFLMLICKRIWLNKIKKNKKLDDSGKLHDNIKSAVEDFWEREKKMTLYEKAFLMLTPKEQELWGLCWTINDKTGKLNTNKEVAKTLNLSPNYVARKKAVIKAKLKKLIEELKKD